ncbi:hypothetical protein [Streptomyces sp. NPDC046261]
MASGGTGPCREFSRQPTVQRAAEGRDLSWMSGIPADISYRLLLV